MVDGSIAFYRVLRREIEAPELEELFAAVRTLQDHDLESGIHDLGAQVAAARGEWAVAASGWREQAAVSDLNKPYALPKAGFAAAIAGDAGGAQRALDQLAELGTRGRAIDADRSTVHAGIAALGGDTATSLALYRTVLAAYRELGLVYDEALLGLAAGTLLGTVEGEVLGWVETARETFGRLRAVGFAEQVEALLASSRASRGRPGVAADQTAAARSSRA